MYERLTVLYCEGWDGARRAVVTPLKRAVALERDRNGEPYSVLGLSDGVPVVLLDVALQDDLYVAWRFDELARRDARYDLRRLDDRVFLLEQVEWRYTDAEQAEMDPRAGRRTVRYYPDGRMVEFEQPRGEGGGTTQSVGRVPRDQLPSLPLVRFGDWAGLAAVTGTVAGDATCVEVGEVPDTVTVSPERQAVRTTSRGRQPGDLEELFRAGTRVPLDGGGHATVEARRVGWLRMPTGELIAADPWDVEQALAFATRVSPGTYPVEMSVGRGEKNGGFELVLAVRLTVASQPVASWEMARHPGEDPRTLGAGEYCGFAVDVGTACLVDATARQAAASVFGNDDEALFNRIQQDKAVVVELAEADATIVAFRSGMGDGWYPTWIGYTAHGDVACFIVDMLAIAESVGRTHD